jgi:hypothetical protein
VRYCVKYLLISMLLFHHLTTCLRIVRVRVEHDQREGEHVGGGRGAEDAGVLLVEAVGKGLRRVRAREGNGKAVGFGADEK